LEDHFKLIQNLFRFIIILSVTLFVFEYAPKVKTMKAALNELTLLRRLPYETYPLHVRDFISRHWKKQEWYQPWGFHSRQKWAQRLADSMKVPLAPDRLYFFVPMSLKNDSDFWKSIKRNVEKDHFGELVSIEIKFRSIGFRRAGRQDNEIKRLLATLPDRKSPVDALFLFSLKDQKGRKTPSDFGGLSVPCEIMPRYCKVPGIAMDWLKTLPKDSRKLAGIQQNSINALPKLQRLWDHVASKSCQEAIVYLEREIAARQKAVSFFGISVDEGRVVWTGLIGTLALSAVLALHLARFSERVVGKEAGVKECPWVPFFPGPVSLCFSFLSIVILPIAANGLMVFRSAIYGQSVGWVGPAILILISLCLVFAWIKVTAIRRRLFEETPTGDEADNSPEADLHSVGCG